MDDGLSLSVFVIDVDGKPVIAFAAKKYADAEVVYRDERIRAKLRSVSSGGKPVCDDFAILRLRLAHPDERAAYYRQVAPTESVSRMIYLVDLDDDDDWAGDPSSDVR